MSEILPYPVLKPDVEFWSKISDDLLDQQFVVWYQTTGAFAELWKLSSDELRRVQGARLAEACTRHLVRQALVAK